MLYFNLFGSNNFVNFIIDFSNFKIMFITNRVSVIKYCLFAIAFSLASISYSSDGVITEFVPPNDPNGMVFSTNQNDVYDQGRGIVFEAMSNVSIGSVGLFQDLTGEIVTFTLSEVTQLTGSVETGQTILATGSQTFTTTGLEWLDFTFAPIALQVGSFYHIDFEFQGPSNQNFFYNNANVPWSQGDFRLLEGTQGGGTFNSVVPAIRVSCPEIETAPIPTLGEWGLLMLLLGFMIVGLIGLRDISTRESLNLT